MYTKIIIANPEKLFPTGFDYKNYDEIDFVNIPILVNNQVVGNVLKKTNTGLECMIFGKDACIKISDKLREPVSIEINLL